MIQHLAIIMDGNRRWARKQGLKSFMGHAKGKDAAMRTAEFCVKYEIPYLSLYAFSLENFKRPEHERKVIFDQLRDVVSPKNIRTFQEKDIRIRFIGDRRYYPAELIDDIDRAETETQQCKALHLNVLFCYGGQQEIVHAAKDLIRKVQSGIIDIDDIDEKQIEQSLWTVGVPTPDLIIRTSGVVRLSNFLLYQAAYSEFAFLDCMWPEITEDDLQKCVESFAKTSRNVGV